MQNVVSSAAKPTSSIRRKAGFGGIANGAAELSERASFRSEFSVTARGESREPTALKQSTSRAVGPGMTEVSIHDGAAGDLYPYWRASCPL